MAIRKYISFDNLTNFLSNLKNTFATKTEVDTKIDTKSDKTHTHSISDITNLQSTLNSKASTSHGTHVTYSTTAPVTDGTASVGSASTVARSDHKHPTDTSRAAKTDLDTHTSNTTSHITSTERNNWNTAYTHSQSSHAPSNAEPNQNAFSNVKIGDVTIAADIKTDTLTLVAGNNITLTPDATNDKITISAKDTTYTLGSFGITASAAEINKLKGVTASTTEINYVDGVTSNIQSQIDNKVPTSRTINGKALSSNITLSASDIGADASGTAQTKADVALSSAKNYTDTKISALINSAPTTLDTLGEIAIAMEENEDVVTALEDAIGTKANTSDLTAHINNKSNPHNVTKAQIGLGNVENKSSATIRSELTKANVTTALGYTPPTTDTTYGVATSSTLGLIKSGTDITIDSSGNVSINDDSHNHTIANIDNLQSSLDTKQATITGGASTITSSNLTANRALISNGSGKVAVSDITSTELGYLDGIKSNVQTQLDGKAASSHGNHVPATQTANNAKFLRNDNTWATVTPANIGAATSGHTHNNINMQNMSNKDLNTLKTQGWYYGYTGMTNAPVQAIGVMEVLVYSQDWIVQRFTVIGATPVTYERHYHTGTTWGSWFTDINSGNISSQSVNYANSAGSAASASTAGSATKATQDASGNTITSTYATKTELDTAKSTLQTSINGKANSSHTHTIANITNLQTTLDGKSDTSHIHKYAGSASVGGSAVSAVKLDTDIAGDANTPVYFSGGKPVACTSLDLNTSGSSASCTGNSATATKLQTARTIALGTGATGTATSFNGTGNITIPVTDVKESYLSWGGRNLSGSVSPLDAACSNIHSANRFAFAKAAGITIEYTTNGSTYSTYNTTDSAKVNLVSGNGNTYYIGARSSSTTVNDKLRITLNATNMGLYTRLQKILINISTSYAAGSNVIVEKAMKGSETTFTAVGTYQISGWSGWNSIPIGAAFGGGSNQTGNIAVLRLTFGITGVNSEQTSNALSVSDIIGIGDTYWSYPSTMAKTGHIYSYDSSQNATFPANVTATTFVGALSGNATTATTASNVAWSGVTSKPSYYDAKAIKGITRSGTTFTYTCMDGTTGTFTQQDNNTTYSVVTTSANGLMSATDKSKLDGIDSGANKYTLPAAGSSLGGVKSGGDVTISNGTITVNDDSHNHIVANVDGLQTALDNKLSLSTGGTVNGNTVLRSSTSVSDGVMADATITSRSVVDGTSGLPTAIASMGVTNSSSVTNYGSATITANYLNEVVLNTSYLSDVSTIKLTPTKATIDTPFVSSYPSWQTIKVSHGTSGKESGFTAERTDTGTCVRFGVGAAGINHGVWSHTQNRWLIHGNANNIFIGENRAYGEKELYNNTTGTADTITLSDSAANYTYLEIHYKDNNGREFNSTKIYSPNGKSTDLFLVEAVASSTLIRRTRYNISGNKLTPDLTTAGYIQIYHNGTANKVGSETNYLRIVRVVGLV